MTTAKRTTLIRHLHLDIGYEQDVSSDTLASAIIEALEAVLVDEMGIVSILADSAYTPGASTLTIYAPVDQVKLEATDPEEPPEIPPFTGPAGVALSTLLKASLHLPECPVMHEAEDSCNCANILKEEEEAASRKPNVG